MLRRVGSGVAAVLLTAGLLAGCSGDDDGGGDSSGPDPTPAGQSSDGTSTDASSATPTEPAAPYLPVPAGVTLTDVGSELAVGDTATVAYEVKQGVVGVLDITVTRLERTSFKKSFAGWDLTDEQRGMNPYFVRATVVNRGETDLSGLRTPLYIVDGTNTLVEPTSFASAFSPCQPGSFPKKFRPGKRAKVCLVYLSPQKGDLTAVSFRPTQKFDPITWTGTLEAPRPPGGKGKGGKGGNGKGGKG